MSTPKNPLAGGPPQVSPALVAFLEALYPDRFPDKILGSDPNSIAADLHRQAGRIEVVRYLRSAMQRQSQTAPPTEATA